MTTIKANTDTRDDISFLLDCLFSCTQVFGNCIKIVDLFLVAVLPVLLYLVLVLIAALYLPLYLVQLLVTVLDVLNYLVLPCGFTDILDFRILANAFCPSIPEHKLQRDLI